MTINISDAVLKKLENKHAVSRLEVEQCFQNRTGHLLRDTREQHETDPPTMWFIAPTNKARLLKVCFIARGQKNHVRTAYEANATELAIYRAKGRPSDF